MGHPSPALRALLDQFICVRVTDMRGVDLRRYPFDFDLTFAAMTLDATGHVYHRYGGRDARGADTWLSAASLEAMLKASLADHRVRAAQKRPAPAPSAPLRIEDVPSFKKRDRGDCIHCHSINTSLYEEARADDSFDADWIWKYSPPGRIGLDLDRDDQRRIATVTRGSPAAQAGLLVGDRLRVIGATNIATASDVMFALDQFPASGGSLALSVERENETLTVPLSLDAGWKRGTPAAFAWRPTKWALTPAPGFGGPRLTPDELAAQGLDRDAFAFRIGYLVTWGDNRRYGEAAKRAGLAKGDVVTAVGGKSDFLSVDHFHAWWRLSVALGQVVKIEVLRGDERRMVELKAIR